MKKIIKEYGSGLVNVVMFVVSLVLMLSPEPGSAITGPGGWMLVRLVAFIWSLVMGVGVASKWKMFIPMFKELLTFKNKNLIKWIVLWIVFVQIMATFFIAEWCVGGL